MPTHQYEGEPMMTIDSDEARKEREQLYHDHAFEENVRAPLDKFYESAKKSRQDYSRQISLAGRGKTVLEYGCGTGSSTFDLVEQGARVTGIDISPVAIRKAQEAAEQLGLSERAEFITMDAEKLTFADESFDLICGTGVLHHLQLKDAYAQLARVLKPGGKAIFAEPLGHNVLVNLYRQMTPQYRTVDEHPMLRSDFDLARQYFGDVQLRFYHLTSLAAVPFSRLPVFQPLLATLDAVDAVLLKLPGLRYQAWTCVVVFSSPRKG
jgi:SAM-dependent methyltransferase